MEEGGDRWPSDPNPVAVPATWDEVVGRRVHSVAAPVPTPAWEHKGTWEPSFAGWWRRAQAFLIDLILAWTLPLALIIAFVESLTPQQLDPPNTNPGPISYVFLVSFYVAGAAALVAYPVWFVGRRGGTPGMKLLRIHLYRFDGEMRLSEPSYKDAWVRWAASLGFLLVFLVGGFLDYLAPLWDRRNRCWHDMAAHTVVVDVQEETREGSVARRAGWQP